MTTSPKSETAAKKDVTKLQRAIIDGLEDVKAQDIQVFNTEHLSPLFERVIVATGSSNRQTKALAASVRDAVREAGFVKPRSEGEENGEWIIVDCGQAVVHVMQPAIRQYYRLEEIWGDKPVRMKLGADKPRKVSASEDAEGKPLGKPATKKAAAKAPARKAVAKAPAKAAAKATKPAGKTAAATRPAAGQKPAVAKKPAGVKGPAAAKKPAGKAAVKTVAVNKPAASKAPAKAAAKTTARKPATKAASSKPAAKKAPARKKP